MTATMPLERIAVRIAEGIRNKDSEITATEPGYIVMDGMDAVLARYACDDPRCPGRPDWDRERSKLYTEFSRELDRRMSDLIDETAADMAIRIEAFLHDHPEAALPEAGS